MIDKYLISNCLNIIDGFNYRYRDINTKEELKEIAINDFTEADIVFRLGSPFMNIATFNMQSRSGDIHIKSKDFIIEVKYLRNGRSKSGSNGTSMSNKANFSDSFEKDYNWLCREIKKGKKGKRMFLLSWFNAVDRFSEVMQLGEGKHSGKFPNIDNRKLKLFPFLNVRGDKTKDIFYMYSDEFPEWSIPIFGCDKVVNCMFIGKETDKFHFAMYY